MRRLKKILAAVDGSPASLHALREAIRLAQWVKGGVTVITVAPSYEGDLSLIGVKDIKAVLQGECEKILSEAMEIAEEHEISLRIICEEGEIAEKIVERAETEEMDLIVLGNAGPRRFIDFFKGGVLSGVSRYSRRDILVIPQGKTLNWSRILLTMDHPDSAVFARRAVEIALTSGAQMTALFVVPGLFSTTGMISGRANPPASSGREVIERVEATAGRHGLKIQGLVANGSMARSIARVVQEQNVELILLASSGESRLHRLTGSSLAQRVARRAQCSLLVLKNPDPAGSQ